MNRQQLTVFPPGLSTGRMMTNAGRSRSIGAEAELDWTPGDFRAHVSWSWCDSRFVSYDDGNHDYAGHFVPYVPRHTLYVSVGYSFRWNNRRLDLDLSARGGEESSADIRSRVMAAREIQNQRFKGTPITCNALITPDKLQEFCPMDDAAETLMKNVFDRLGLSARAYDRILKVARTIADIDGSEVIRKNHVAAAAQFRSLDRKYWTE